MGAIEMFAQEENKFGRRMKNNEDETDAHTHNGKSKELCMNGRWEWRDADDDEANDG